MERLTKRQLTSNGEVICKQNNPLYDCNDSCMNGICGWNKKALRKLKDYEDLEEQGLLLRLPCKVGDELYRINCGAKEPIIKMRVLQINFKQLHKDRNLIRIDTINDKDMGEGCYLLDDLGKTVFLTQAEAEQKLKEWRVIKC